MTDREGERSREGLSDEECIVLARSGNRRAQEELVRRYTPPIFNLFARTLLDRDVAADLTQEVFLRLFREIASFDPARPLKPWVFAIAWNLARDCIRRRATRGREMRSLDWEPAGGGDAFPEPADPRGDAPAEELEARERRELVREALAKVEPRRRALLVLREFEGLSYDEISELCRMRVGTVKSGIHRARMELKDAFLALRPEGTDAL